MHQNFPNKVGQLENQRLLETCYRLRLLLLTVRPRICSMLIMEKPI